MPRKKFNDDISVLSDDKASSRRSSLPAPPLPQSASFSPQSKKSPFMKRIRKLSQKGGGSGGIDDVSVSDSLCSGVIRDAIGGSSARSLGGSARTASSAWASLRDIGDSIGATGRSASSAPLVLPGGVADFNNNEFNRRDSNGTNGSSIPSNSNDNNHNHSNNPFNDSVNSSQTPSTTGALSIIADESQRREARKERVKEKLDRYKQNQKQLKQSCVALEAQLSQTTLKLKEVDSRAAFKIDSLESELRETRVGMEQVAKQSTREVTDQSACIKTLGKKLIRQAHVIKRQKNAVEQYKVQMEALKEEMAMQDERDSKQDEEFNELMDQFESAKEQKVQMQNLLQENIEEMMDLKSETERDAKCIMELEFNLQQKEAMLDRVAKEKAEKDDRICKLDEELEEKNWEVENMTKKLKEGETKMEEMKKELETVNGEVEELRCQYAAWGTNSGGGGDGLSSASPDRRASSRLSAVAGSPDKRGSAAMFGWKPTEEREAVETFEAELQAKDATIQTLDDTVKDHEETIQSLRSDMVKMSSTYKTDSYLKRKEIAKLKQMNAEYALKLRALEKAFKCVSATENMSMNGSRHHGHTMHGSPTGGGVGSSSLHGGLSRHGKSLHSVSSASSKEEKAAAVKARLGGVLAPYEFPVKNDPQIVLDSNFFDSASDQASEDGRKGELPEEC
ncbi:hypothetical protein ACHAXR_007004 [Thalassiosira sp. AJA248-18]